MSGLLCRSVVSFVVFAFCFSLSGLTYAVEEKEKTNIDCSIEKKTVTIIPKDGVKLSAKKIWEIMEGISKTQIKLVLPEGTFTSKPK
jgi:hypothetical protein